MNPLSYVWFWVAVIAIVCIIVAYSFSEGVGQSFGNNTTTPLWVWILWGVGIVLLIISFVLYCIAAARNYQAKKIKEACDPDPKKVEVVVCPVKKPCGCAVEVQCGCVKHAHVAPLPPAHVHVPVAAPISVQPIQYQYPDQKLFPHGHAHAPPQLYYANENVNVDIRDQLPALIGPDLRPAAPVYTTTLPPVQVQAPVYTSFPQAPAYAVG